MPNRTAFNRKLRDKYSSNPHLKIFAAQTRPPRQDVWTWLINERDGLPFLSNSREFLMNLKDKLPDPDIRFRISEILKDPVATDDDYPVILEIVYSSDTG